jgi:ribosomal protein S18 acetylase RimI-like enzyme
MIEPATPDDVSAMTELWVELARDQRAHGSRVLGRDNESTVRHSIGERVVDERAFVAKDGGEIVGFVTVVLENGAYHRDVRRGIVENVYVAPEQRGRGLGTALIERAEAALAAREVDVVTLEVLVDNEAARRLYEELGYEDHRLELEKPLGSDSH